MCFNDQSENDSHQVVLLHQGGWVKNHSFAEGFKFTQTIHQLPNHSHKKHHKGLKKGVWSKLHRVESKKPHQPSS
jgi:hypothetical protein